MIYTLNHHFEMIKLGKKSYGFRIALTTKLVAHYRCSHPEALRRFNLAMLTARLLK